MDPLPLSVEAREVMRKARDLARADGADRADRQHVLLAVLAAPGARRLFDAFRTQTDRLADAVGFLTASQPAVTFDRMAEEVIVGIAASEARRLGQGSVGGEHLVVALTHRPDTIAGGVLASMGVTRDAAREAVRFLHGLVPDWDPPERDLDGPFGRTAPLEFVDDPEIQGPSAEMLERIDLMSRAAGGGPGRLIRVVGIGLTSSLVGIDVELIALEVRERSAVLTWRARPDEPWLLGSPEVRVTDDAGTGYQAMSTGSGGGEHVMSGEVTIVPAPPGIARMLTVEFVGFGGDRWFPAGFAPGIRHEQATGPWRFEVPLRE